MTEPELPGEQRYRLHGVERALDTLAFLAAAGTIISLCTATYDVCGIVRKLLNKLRSEPAKTILAFLHDLGCRSDADIRRLVEQ